MAYHNFSPSLFGSVGEDRTILLWDTKQNSKNPTTIIYGHHEEINSISFSPFNEYLFLTGSSDKNIGLWDLRNPSKRLHTLEGHTSDVFKVEWSPFNECIFASCSMDRRSIVWDLSKIGDEQTAEEGEDGPPEILFTHGGHRAKVPDISWSPNDNLVIASVEEENNILQVWQMVSFTFPLLNLHKRPRIFTHLITL